MEVKEFLLTSTHTYICLWDCEHGHVVKKYQNEDSIGSKCMAAYSRDYFITAPFDDAKVNHWLFHKDEVHLSTRLHFPGKVSCLVISNNDELLIIAMDRSLIIWNAITGQLIRAQAHESNITCMKCSMPGDKLIVGFESGMVMAYKNNLLARPVASMLHSVCPVYHKHDHTAPIVDMHAGRYTYIPRIATISLDQTFSIYDADSGTLMLRSGFNVPLTSVVADRCFRSLLIGTESGTIKKVLLWYMYQSDEILIHKNLTIDYAGHTKKVVTLDVNCTDKVLVSGGEDRMVILWDLFTACILRQIQLDNPITNVMFLVRPEKVYVYSPIKLIMALEPIEAGLPSTS